MTSGSAQGARSAGGSRGIASTAMARTFCLAFLGVLAACAMPVPPPLPVPAPLAPPKADLVVVLKGERAMVLKRGETDLKRFKIALGRNPVGHKRERGDMRTPEGTYVLDQRNPESFYYRSIHISYPNAEDVAQARKRGVSPGGDIMIHGLPTNLASLGPMYTPGDWTDGCIAVTNAEMDLLWEMVDDMTPIEIRP